LNENLKKTAWILLARSILTRIDDAKFWSGAIEAIIAVGKAEWSLPELSGTLLSGFVNTH